MSQRYELVWKYSDNVKPTLPKIETYRSPMWNDFWRLYYATLKQNMEKINLAFIEIYGRTLKINQSHVTDTILALKALEKRFKCTLKEICDGIRKYLGYNTSFYRFENKRRTPIELSRIGGAYELIRSKKSTPIEVENYLFLT